MGGSNMEFVFFSKDNYSVGEKLKNGLKQLGKNVMYCGDIEELLCVIMEKTNIVVFVDACFKKYIKLISALLSSNIEPVRFCRVVFIDESIGCYENYLNENNFFFLQTESVLDELFGVVAKCETCFGTEKTEIRKNVGTFVSEYLMSLGFSHKLVGFKYLKQCIELVVQNNYNFGSLSGEIYPQVAKLNQASESSIERSIRTAIKTAQGVTDFYKMGFCKEKCKKCTNKYFISCFIDKMTNNYKCS